MKSKRRLICESLEKRRLLAANCQPLPPQTDVVLVAAEGEQQASLEVNADGTVAQNLTVADVGRPDIFYGTPDLVQEVDGRLFVVDQEPFSNEGGRLFVFDRLDDGSFETSLMVETEFHVDRMMVVGDQVLLFGTDHNWHPLPWLPPGSDAADDGGSSDPRAFEIDPILPHWPRTLVATVNVGGDGAEADQVTRQEFDGILKDVYQDGDQLVMVLNSSQFLIAIYPPPPTQDFVVLSKITAEGLQEVASIEIESGMTQVRGDNLLSVVTRHSDIHLFAPGDVPIRTVGSDAATVFPHLEPLVVATQYRLGESSIEKVGELELGNGFVHQLNMSDDGHSANVIRSNFRATGSSSTAIDLLALSGDPDDSDQSLQLFETVLIPEFDGYPIASGAEFVLLRDYGRTDSLVLVNTNMSIDLAAENRVSRVEIPESLNLLHTYATLSDGQVVLMANRYVDHPFLDLSTNALFAPQSPETVLVNISVTEGAVKAITELEEIQALPPYELYVIDAEADRFGFLASGTTAAGDYRAQFNFGRLGDAGHFVSDGVIEDIGFWREIDANSDRLVIRGANRIVQYDWDNPGEPVAVIPLVDPDAPPIEAVDDAYTVVSVEDQILEVLANDQIPEIFPPIVEIVELIGAPEGAEILGHAILIPAAAFESGDSLRFEYVISDGLNTSTAVVEIAVDVITEEEVESLVEAVRRQAADDFGVTVDEVQIVVVERVFDHPLPVVLPDGGVEIDLSPGILVTLNVPDATAFYAASLDGQIYQLFSSKREILAELGLRAVDDDGVQVETLIPGQEFWLEFIADDLRDFGKGVYAAFFDLDVPTDHIMLTDIVEYGPGFAEVAGGELREDGLTDFGSLSFDVESPGGAAQQIFRIRAVAVTPGDVTLRPQASDGIGTATLLHGVNHEVESSQVRYRPLQLMVTDEPQGDPLDVDGSGEVTANDALRVINFLGTFGSTTLDELADRVADVRGEGESNSGTTVDQMRRYDSNRDGKITALDALVIVNNLDANTLAAETPEPEQPPATIPMVVASTLGDDDDDEDESEAPNSTVF